MPTADEQEKAAEEAAELAALKAQPGASVGPLKAAPPPPPPVVAEWTPPPLPEDAEERMAEVMAATTDSSPSPLRGEGWGGGETHVPNQAASPPPGLPPQGGGEEKEEEVEERDAGRDPDKTRQNPTKPYTGESRVFAATNANGASVDAGAPLDDCRIT